MRATEFITEAFDKPYKLLRWEEGDFGDVDAIARLDDGTFLSIMFNKGFSKGTKEEAWSVEFFRNNSQEVTGEGDAQRVFATVLSAMQTFIKKYKPNKIIFSASKEVEDGQNTESRARLYDSLVQRYARAWGFRALRADTGNKVIYELSRIIKGVAENMDHSKDHQAVDELKAALVARRQRLQSASDDQVYDIIDKLMTRIAKTHSVSGQKLHDMWVDQYHEVPDTWIMNENFADGKKPGRKGLAKRSGVNCKQPVSKLRSIAANSSGERQRMAHWCANMKSGKKK
jgi:hypothetical protein